MIVTSPSGDEQIDTGNGSDGSGESIGGASERSSTYEEPKIATKMQIDVVKDEEDGEQENSIKLHQLRILILDKIIENFASINEVNGKQVIPFMQVILMLTTDLDGSQDVERTILTKLLTVCVEKLEISQSSQLSRRSPKSKVQLNILRFVGILMGKLKTLNSSKSSQMITTSSADNIQFVASATASFLMRSGAVAFCLAILESFLPYWKQNSSNSDNSQTATAGAHIVTSGGMPTKSLLKPAVHGPVLDMQPFFARQYIKELSDVFELYPQVSLNIFE
jgi:E3 ubiquitin-protein ligase UBR4